MEFHKWKKTEFGYDEEYVGDIIFSSNLSFIPVDLRYGPRGAMYVCDWYNPIKGHAQYSLRDERRDRKSGRIWRIVPKGAKMTTPPKLAGTPVQDLLNVLKRPEYRYRYWAKRELPLANDRLHPSLDERSQARDVANWLKRYKKNVYQTVGVGTADPNVVPHLERAFRDAHIRQFDPTGQPIRRTSLHAFLQSLLAVLQSPTFANADALLRLPDTWSWLKEQDESIDPTALQRGLDELRLKHIPADLAAATRLEFVPQREDEKIGYRITARSALCLSLIHI